MLKTTRNNETHVGVKVDGLPEGSDTEHYDKTTIT